MAVTLVGSASHNELAAAASSIAVTRNGIVAGNLIVVAVTCADTFAINNVSDGTTTNSTPDVTFHWATGTQNLAIFSFPNHSGGNFTFTANFAGLTAFRCVDVIELQGAAGSSPLEGTASASGTSAAPSSGNVTPAPTVDGEYVVGFGMGATALTSGSGFADLVNDPTINTSDFEGKAQAVHAAIAATWTMASGIWGAIASSYKPVAGTIVIPGVGVLTVAGLAPTAVLTDNKLALPGAGAIAVDGLAPTINSGVHYNDVILGTGYATSNDVVLGRYLLVSAATGGATPLPGAGALTIAGLAPAAIVNNIIAADVGSLTLTGFLPTILLPQVVLPGIGALVLAGLAPTVLLPKLVAAGVGALTLAGLSPTVLLPQTVTPDVGALTLIGFAPLALTPVVVVADVGMLALAGIAPAVVVASSGSATVLADTGVLTLDGFAPTVVATVDPVRISTASGGPTGAKHRKRFIYPEPEPAFAEAAFEAPKPWTPESETEQDDELLEVFAMMVNEDLF